jgi:hypothetical protein
MEKAPLYTVSFHLEEKAVLVRFMKDGEPVAHFPASEPERAAAWIRESGAARLHSLEYDSAESESDDANKKCVFRFSEWRDSVLKTLKRIHAHEVQDGSVRQGAHAERVLILRPTVRGPSVVICHEKHGDLYFYVEDDVELFGVALSIVRGRLRSGHWYYKPEEEPRNKPDFTREDVSKMPASLQEDARKKLNSYSEKLKRWEHEQSVWADINKAVETKDGYLAWTLLRDLGGEYSRVSVEEVKDRYYQDEEEPSSGT